MAKRHSPAEHVISDVSLKGPDEYPEYERWNYRMDGTSYYPIRIRKGAAPEVVLQYIQGLQAISDARERQMRKDADLEEKWVSAEYDRHEKRMQAIKDKVGQAKKDREKIGDEAECELYDRLFPR